MHEGVGEVEFDAVVFTMTGDDVDGNPRSQRYVVPAERWPDINRMVVHAIRSSQMAQAFAAAALPLCRSL